ncbi:MAG: alpha-L-fucosidase [Lachnospiraceae bacterium]
MNRRIISMFLAGVMLLGTAAGATDGMYMTALAADGFISDSDLMDHGTEAPEKDAVVPDANQYEYQKQELAAFGHFGLNTFNEIEWGENYGNKTPDEIFRLEDDFDADTMVSRLKEAGFQKLIITAKHHDGFCIWDSAYTDYDVAATSYTDAEGNSDILAEVSAACTKYDMDMGLYLSPWDIHEKSYGYYDENGNATTADKDVLDYNDYYNKQLQEIFGNDQYGNNGHFNEVWMDGAKGSGG